MTFIHGKWFFCRIGFLQQSRHSLREKIFFEVNLTKVTQKNNYKKLVNFLFLQMKLSNFVSYHSLEMAPFC